MVNYLNNSLSLFSTIYDVFRRLTMSKGISNIAE